MSLQEMRSLPLHKRRTESPQKCKWNTFENPVELKWFPIRWQICIEIVIGSWANRFDFIKTSPPTHFRTQLHFTCGKILIKKKNSSKHSNSTFWAAILIVSLHAIGLTNEIKTVTMYREMSLYLVCDLYFVSFWNVTATFLKLGQIPWNSRTNHDINRNTLNVTALEVASFCKRFVFSFKQFWWFLFKMFGPILDFCMVNLMLNLAHCRFVATQYHSFSIFVYFFPLAPSAHSKRMLTRSLLILICKIAGAFMKFLILI